MVEHRLQVPRSRVEATLRTITFLRAFQRMTKQTSMVPRPLNVSIDWILQSVNLGCIRTICIAAYISPIACEHMRRYMYIRQAHVSFRTVALWFSFGCKDFPSYSTVHRVYIITTAGQ